MPKLLVQNKDIFKHAKTDTAISILTTSECIQLAQTLTLSSWLIGLPIKYLSIWISQNLPKLCVLQTELNLPDKVCLLYYTLYLSIFYPYPPPKHPFIVKFFLSYQQVIKSSQFYLLSISHSHSLLLFSLLLPYSHSHHFLSGLPTSNLDLLKSTFYPVARIIFLQGKRTYLSLDSKTQWFSSSYDKTPKLFNFMISLLAVFPFVTSSFSPRFTIFAPAIINYTILVAL